MKKQKSPKTKGFLTAYILVILSMTILCGSTLIALVGQDSKFHEHDDLFYKANWVEVLVIDYIRQCYHDFNEADEIFWFDGFLIEIAYDDLQAEFAISYGDFIRERILIYDDITDTVVSYH